MVAQKKSLLKMLKNAKRALSPYDAGFTKGMKEMLKRLKDQEEFGHSAMVGMKQGKNKLKNRGRNIY